MGMLRRRKIPAAARPKLDRDERVVAWASTSEGKAAVVTNLGLWMPDRERIGWHQIHKASWAGTHLTVVPSTLVAQRDGYDVMADDAAIDVALSDPGDVPAQVRDRVTRSVAYTEHHVVPGGGVRVVGRRIPGRDGLSWHVRYDDGTDPSSESVMAATEELVATINDTSDPDDDAALAAFDDAADPDAFDDAADPDAFDDAADSDDDGINGVRDVGGHG
jgi:hypothetical protein